MSGVTNYAKDYLPSDYKIPAEVLSLFPENNNCIIFPGFCDVHVHFREPGFSYKETIRTGTMAAARGGFTHVCTMPNLNPVPDCRENLDIQLDIINDTAVIGVYPFAAATVGQKGEVLTDFMQMCDSVVGFSDDGKGIQNPEIMRKALLQADEYSRIISAHCEDNSLVRGGYINDGEYARKNGHNGICNESEWGPVKRDLQLVKETGAAYHICHVSCRETVELIRSAKKEGLNVTCETAPHYLLLDDSYLCEDGKFKMNPPLRSREDRLALLEGIKDGTVDMIATDHAPHSREEKSKGLKDSAFGIVGLETAFPLMYTYLVKTGDITLNKLIELMCVNPRKRFGMPFGKCYTVWDLDCKYKIDTNDFLSKGKSTPFEDREVYGKCIATVYNGKLVYGG